MNILVAEYASALGMGGTCELEGRAMLSTLVESFERCGHSVAYPTHGPKIKAGDYVLVDNEREFEVLLESIKVDAALLIAPDDLQPRFLKILKGDTANLGSSPDVARTCADKAICTSKLVTAGVPVAEIVTRPEPCEMGCRRYVIKPRYGCG
jgi:predicted ATP-grasp superfamily ATP-dependent carboligase